MAFKTKTDYFNLGDIAGIEVTSSSQNKAASNAEAQGENGFVVAHQTYAELEAPACDYILTAKNVQLSGITLGSVFANDGKSYCLGSVSITTGAGQVPTVNATGQQVEESATAACTAPVGSISMTGLHHAQTFGAFSFTGTGAHLTQSTFNATCTINVATKDGVPLAHDITDGRLEVNGTLQVSDSSYGTPTLSAANGWSVTAPLTETNPDSDYPTYGFTVTKYLTAVEPS